MLTGDSIPLKEPYYTSDDEYNLTLLYRAFQEKVLTKNMLYFLNESFSNIMIVTSSQENNILMFIEN